MGDNTATSVPSNDGRFDPPTPSPTTTNENNQTVGPMNNNDSLSGIPSSAPSARYATTGSPTVKCPIPNGDVMCIADYDPYRCGADSCIYPNKCLARAANYDIARDCVKVNDMDNTATSVPSNNGRFDPPTPSPTTTNENNQTVGPMNNNDSLSGIPSSAPTSRGTIRGKPSVKFPIHNPGVFCYMKHEPYRCGAD